MRFAVCLVAVTATPARCPGASPEPGDASPAVGVRPEVPEAAPADDPDAISGGGGSDVLGGGCCAGDDLR